jgi:hypothetical protein
VATVLNATGNPANLLGALYSVQAHAYRTGQHTPAVPLTGGQTYLKMKTKTKLTSTASHDTPLEFFEQRSLEGFGENISDHLGGGAVLNTNIPLLHLVGDEKIPDINGSRPLARALLSILLKQNRALIVLV